MSEYGNMTLDEYRDTLASDSPTPGGGSAAAIALSQAAALATMVCNLTEGREKWKDGWIAAENTRSVSASYTIFVKPSVRPNANAFPDARQLKRPTL